MKEPAATPAIEPSQPPADNPYLIPETPENIVAAPEVPAANVEPSVNVPATEVVIPEDLTEEANKNFGGDMNKAIASLSKSNTDTKRGFHEASQKVKELEKELENERLVKGNVQPSHQAPAQKGEVYPQVHFSQWDEDTRTRFYNEFRKTPEEYDADVRLMNSVISPVMEATANSQLSVERANLRRDNPNFTPEVEKDFDVLINGYDYRDRMNPHIIKDCLNTAIGRNADSIIASRLEVAKKELVGNPDAPPPINPPANGNPPKPQVNIGMTNQEVNNASAYSGFTPDELKTKMVGGKQNG